jgi:hypothetical protein
MNTNLCPLCRQTMRLWALDARFRVITDEMRGVCIRTAKGFRDECCHTDREKFNAITAKLATLNRSETTLRTALWNELERIKNCNGGYAPTGRTFNAWRLRPLPKRSHTNNRYHFAVKGGHYAARETERQQSIQSSKLEIKKGGA